MMPRSKSSYGRLLVRFQAVARSDREARTKSSSRQAFSVLSRWGGEGGRRTATVGGMGFAEIAVIWRDARVRMARARPMDVQDEREREVQVHVP